MANFPNKWFNMRRGLMKPATPAPVDATGAFRFWRIKSLATPNGLYLAIGDIEFRQVAGVSEVMMDAAVAFTANTVYAAGYEASKAFDRSSSSFYCSQGYDAAGHVTAEFSAPRRVTEVMLMSYSSGGDQMPRDFQIQASNDGISFVTVASYNNEFFGANQSKTFAAQT